MYIKQAIFTAFLVAAVAITPMTVLYAEENTDDTTQMDLDYEGPVDIYTGTPLTDESADENGAQLVRLADGGSFDRKSHKFIYAVDGDQLNIYSTVFNGIITTDNVSIESDEGLSLDLYKNGNIVKNPNFSAISAPGAYSVVVGAGESQSQVLSFRIISKLTGEINSYSLPAGFYATSVTIDNETQTGINTSTVDMSGEGEYNVRYRCQATSIDYSLKVTLDHIAPKFKLKGVKDGVARGPVIIQDIEKGEDVTVKKNGNTVSFVNNNTLKSTGKYEVTVTDDAGNETTKKFVIKMYLNYQSIIFLIVIAGIIAAAVGYMYFSNKKLKVR